MSVNKSIQGVTLVDEDGEPLPTLVEDGAREFAVRDEELLSVLKLLLKETRTIRMMLGHATEIGFATENEE